MHQEVAPIIFDEANGQYWTSISNFEYICLLVEVTIVLGGIVIIRIYRLIII
jgi:hypothetical protein